VLALLAGVVAWRLLRRPRAQEDGRWRLPEPLTPFTALGLLERIKHEGKLTEVQRGELLQATRELERRYFAAGNGDGAANGHADLKAVAEGWLRQVR
jgi:hypothetical protein